MGKKKRKMKSEKSQGTKTGADSRNRKSRREETARKIYQHAVRSIQENRAESEQYKGSLDYDPRRIKSRIRTAIGFADELCQRIGNVCPDHPEFFTIEEDWIETNLHPCLGYDAIENATCTSLGAAVWMLDQIRDQGKLPDEIALLQTAAQYDQDYFMPSVWDPCYSEQTLSWMVSVIRNRNDDCVGLNKDKYRNKEWDTVGKRIYWDLYTLEGQQNQAVPSRQLFESILSMISRDCVEDAVRTYEEKWWEWVTRYYRSRAVFVRREAEINAKLDALTERINQQLEKMSSPQTGGGGLGSAGFTQTPSFLFDDVPVIQGLPRISQQSLLQQTRKWKEERDCLEEERTRLYYQITSLWDMIGLIPTWSFRAVSEVFGKEIAEIWDDFAIEDPYKLCFAQLYLIDTGRDLLWMTFPGTSLMLTFAATLPWGTLRFTGEPEGMWMHYEDAAEEFVPGYQKMELPKRIKLPTMENWYKLVYQDTMEKDTDNAQRYSLSHILYGITGCIMPRNLERVHPALLDLDRYGIRGKLALHPLIYCISLLSEARHQIRLNWDGTDSQSQEQTASSPGLHDYEEDINVWRKKRIAELEAELERLRAEDAEFALTGDSV